MGRFVYDFYPWVRMWYLPQVSQTILIKLVAIYLAIYKLEPGKARVLLKNLD